MIRSHRPPRASRILLVLLLACLLPAAGTARAAESTVTYVHESAAAYEKQLAAGEIERAKINKRVRHLDLTLKNGQHFVYVYPAHDEATVAAQVSAKHVPLEVLTPAAALTETKKAPVHHKLRYIVGGIVIAIVVIVGVVLLVDRRRKQLAE